MMEEIENENKLSIEVKNMNGSLVVSSRAISTGLNIRHKDVLAKVRKCLNEREYSPITYLDNRNREQMEYALPKDSFILLMMNYEGHNDFKRAYIERFNQMENQLKPEVMQLPQDYPSALRALADKVEEAEKYKIERDYAIKTKGQISSRREALVLGKYGNAVKHQKKLDKKIIDLEHDLQVISELKDSLTYIQNKKASSFDLYNGLVLPEFLWYAYDVYPDKKLNDKPKFVIDFFKDKHLNFEGLKDIKEVLTYLDIDEKIWQPKLIDSQILNEDLSPTQRSIDCGLIVFAKDIVWTTRDGRLFLKWVFYGEHGGEWEDVSKFARTICKYNLYFKKLSKMK